MRLVFVLFFLFFLFLRYFKVKDVQQIQRCKTNKSPSGSVENADYGFVIIIIRYWSYQYTIPVAFELVQHLSLKYFTSYLDDKIFMLCLLVCPSK